LPDDPSIVFLFVGGGARLPALKDAVTRHGLTNFQFKSYQNRSRLAETMSVPDLHVISLRPELEGLVIPSKFYAILAAGRPMVFIGDPKGELAQIIAKLGCGWSVTTSDSKEVIRLILFAHRTSDNYEAELIGTVSHGSAVRSLRAWIAEINGLSSLW